MTDLLIQAGLSLCATGMLGSFTRLLRGPDLADRVLALDAISVQSLTLFAGLALLQHRSEILVPMMVIALIGFVATVSPARLINLPPS
jgi:multisubunit Na+/H+ antiporter MnhF subunit